MHDTHRMRGVENAHDRRKNVQCFGGGKPSARFDSVIERMTFDILHHHVDGAVSGGAKIVNGHCVGMAKTTRRLSFAPEASQPFGVVF